MEPIFTIQDIGAANGYLKLLKDGKPFFNFGGVGGGTWTRINRHWNALRLGPRTRISITGRYDDTLGFDWMRDINLIVKADNLHPAKKTSKWKRNLDKSTYRIA